jgi:hypothetical protein
MGMRRGGGAAYSRRATANRGWGDRHGGGAGGPREAGAREGQENWPCSQVRPCRAGLVTWFRALGCPGPEQASRPTDERANKAGKLMPFGLRAPLRRRTSLAASHVAAVLRSSPPRHHRIARPSMRLGAMQAHGNGRRRFCRDRRTTRWTKEGAAVRRNLFAHRVLNLSRRR